MVLKPQIVCQPQLSQRDEFEARLNKVTIKKQASVYAKVATGTLDVVPSDKIQLQEIAAGSTVSSEVFVVNNSLVDLNYRLECQTKAAARVWLDHNEGLLPGRSRRALVVRVQPLEEGEMNIDIVVQNVVDPPAKSTKKNLLTVSVQCVTPRFCVTDIQSAGLSKGRLWRQLDITDLNAALNPQACLSLSKGSSGLKSVYEPQSESITLDFGSGTQGDEDRLVVMCLTNAGTCAAEWSLLFPNDITYQPEPWAENDNPSATEAHCKDILNHGIFSVLPKKGRLSAGESCFLSMRYRFGMPCEQHCLPAVLRVSHRPDVYLHLLGRTTHSGQGHVYLPNPYHVLEPQPIGIFNPPTQFYRLYNDGDRDMDFTVDLSPIQALNQHNYSFSILESGEASGCVPAKGSALVPLRFRPLEEKVYTVDLPISFSCAGAEIQKGTVLTVSGQGFDPRTKMSLSDTIDEERPADSSLLVPKRHEIPAVPKCVLEHQLAFLSHNHIDFGDLPAFGHKRRIVYVRNLHQDRHVGFSWDCAEFSVVVSVTPSRGVLAPGAVRQCVVKFTAVDGVCLYDFDLVCNIVDQTAQDEFEQSMREMEAAREEAEQCFTYTDAGRTGRGRTGGYKDVTTGLGQRSARGSEVPISNFPQKTLVAGFAPTLTSSFSPSMHDSRADAIAATVPRRGTGPKRSKNLNQERPTSGPRLQRITGVHKSTTAVTDSDLRTSKYQALPPIKLNETVRAPTPESPPSCPPLYVGIVASVFAPDDAPRDVFIDTTMVDPLRSQTGEDGDKQMWREEEAEVVTDVLTTLLQEALHDESFQEAVAGIHDEPLPYFAQLQQSLDQKDPTDTSYVPPHAYKFIESLLDNTLSNLLVEARDGEFDLTARPRIVALPTSRPSSSSSGVPK
eukprot:m.192948 g.192948  ORF g.192948 m.192948 type:complete len:897 (-) comp25758_c1_seq2:33-2723(-)